jgi:hypothetical protein
MTRSRLANGAGPVPNVGLVLTQRVRKCKVGLKQARRGHRRRLGHHARSRIPPLLKP